MESAEELDVLVVKLRQARVVHLERELELAWTFLELGRVEHEMHNDEASAGSIGHARQAVEEARRDLTYIEDDERRPGFEARIGEASAAIARHESGGWVPTSGGEEY